MKCVFRSKPEIFRAAIYPIVGLFEKKNIRKEMMNSLSYRNYRISKNRRELLCTQSIGNCSFKNAKHAIWKGVRNVDTSEDWV